MVKGSVGFIGHGLCGIVAFVVCGGRINVGCDSPEQLWWGRLSPFLQVSSAEASNALLNAAS